MGKRPDALTESRIFFFFLHVRDSKKGEGVFDDQVPYLCLDRL